MSTLTPTPTPFVPNPSASNSAACIGGSLSTSHSWLHQEPRFLGGKKTQQDQQPITPATSKGPTRRLIAAVDCASLPKGGWHIPDGSVIPPYTQIPPLSVIGKDCVFGHHCTVLDACTIGSDCVFGEACSFIGLPVFGDRCVFAGHCEFSAGARFGAACVFGPVPLFNFDTTFGPYCVFAEGTNWDEFGLEFGHGCVGAPVHASTEAQAATGVQHVH